MDVSNGSVYPHLKALEEGGIIFSKQDGKRKVYKLTPFGEEWIKNSTNASIPKILGHSFLKLTRKFDLVDWKDREDIKELILNLDYMKSDLEKYLHTLEENEND